MIKAVIIDDDIVTISVLTKLVNELPDIELVESFSDPVAAMEELNILQPDLLFVDIEMPGMSGLDLVKSLNFKANFIFVSAHSSYAIDGFNLDAIDFLVKPIELGRFEIAVNKAKNNISQGIKNEEGVGFIFLKDLNKHDKVHFDDILVVKSDMDYLHVHTKEKRYVLLHTLKDMLVKLEKHGFIKVHKSYLINQNKIDEVDIENHCLRVGDMEVPFSRRMKKELFIKLKLNHSK
jgi:DNA-binding LytR/AlgR family response regulator